MEEPLPPVPEEGWPSKTGVTAGARDVFPICATVRDGTTLLDELLYYESDLKIEEHLEQGR